MTFLFKDVIKKVFSRVYEGFKCSESITKYISNFYIENLPTRLPGDFRYFLRTEVKSD